MRYGNIFNQQNNTTGGGAVAAPFAFFAPLLANLNLTYGSGVLTFARTSTAYVLGVGPNDNAVDGQKAILCSANEARFWGARRIGANNWTTTYQDGSAIPDANLNGYWDEPATSNGLGATNAIVRTMTDVGWVNVTMTVGSATGLDGVAAAGASLTATGASATSLFTTVLGALVRTYSVWVRRKTGVGTIEITKDGGATWTAIVPTGTYQMFQVTTAAVANPIVGFRITTNGDAIEVDFNQLEDLSKANPTPIPVGVSKTVDSLTAVCAGNLSGTVGTLYLEYMFGRDFTGTKYPFFTGAAQLLRPQSATILTDFDGTNNPTLATVGARNAMQRYKAAMSWSAATVNGAEGGVTAGAQAFDGDFNIGANFTIGGGGSAASISGGVRNVKIYPAGTVLSGAALQALTT